MNNAGICPLGPFVEEDDVTARRLVDINVHGVMLGMKLALPRFVARGQGHLINIASAAGKSPYPGGATYCGTEYSSSASPRASAASSAGRASTVRRMPVVVDTELASGVGTARGIPRVRPDDVAAAIVETLRRPRFDVYVPKAIGPLTALVTVLPRPVRELAMRVIGADRVLWVDPDRRLGYELRAARSSRPWTPRRRPLNRTVPATSGRPSAAGPVKRSVGRRCQVVSGSTPSCSTPRPKSVPCLTVGM